MPDPAGRRALIERVLGGVEAWEARWGALLHAGMADGDDPVFLSTLRVDAGAFADPHPGIDRDAESARVLRSVLMKPEQTTDWLAGRVEMLAGAATSRSRATTAEKERP